MVKSSENVLKLVDGIYEAAVNPARLPETLSRIADTVGGGQFMLGVHAFSGARPSAMMPRVDPALLDSYHRRWARYDVQWLHTASAPVGKVLLAEDSVPRDEFRRTAIFNEWYRQAGIGAAGMGVNLNVHDGVPVVLGIRRSARGGDFSREDVGTFQLLAPHLVRAVKLHRLLCRERLAAEAAGVSARQNCSGIVIVDGARRILHLDGGANRLLDARDGLCVEGGRLKAVDRSTDSALAGIVGRCGCEVEELPAWRPLPVARGEGRAPLQLEAMPLRGGPSDVALAWPGADMPTAIVLITEPQSAQLPPQERLCARFGFTPAEADLAREIARGDGRNAAAERLGISVGTVRTHLSRIFEKAGVRRQAELVKVVLKSSDHH